MKLIAPLAIAGAITASAFAQQHEQIPAPVLFSIRGGETLLLRVFTTLTSECVGTFQEFNSLDILDGPPEVTLKFEPAKVHVSTVGGKVCSKALNGGNVMITAKDVTEEKEANLTFRIRYKTQNTIATATSRYHLMLFPAPEPKPAAKE
jgi:hypothetical protein